MSGPRLPFAFLLACVSAGCVTETRRESLPPVLEAGMPLDGASPDAPFRFKGEAFTNLSRHSDARVGSDLEPELSPDGKWLVFCSTRHDEQPEIYLKNVTGSAVIRKTFHPALDCQPAFSPDGSRIAFCSNRGGDFDLFVMSAQGREAPVALTQGDGDEMHPSWSPDGGRIAYCAYDPHLADWELKVLDVATGQRTSLGIRGLYPSWSPDGRRLAFQRARERGEHWYSVWTVELSSAPGSALVEASNPTEVLAGPDWGAITPAWSRDARHLVFVTVERGLRPAREGWKGKDLWMTALDGSGLVQLTQSGEAVSSPSWGGDDRIYYVSDRSGSRCIWSLKPALLEPLPSRDP